MHLIDEGVMKKILTALVKNKCIGAFVDANLISDRMMNLVKRNIPSEFTRDCRRLTYISYFKATEFKQILNYTGIVVIFKNLILLFFIDALCGSDSILSNIVKKS